MTEGLVDQLASQAQATCLPSDDFFLSVLGTEVKQKCSLATLQANGSLTAPRANGSRTNPLHTMYWVYNTVYW